MSEYSNSATSGSSCSYATLGSYNGKASQSLSQQALSYEPQQAMSSTGRYTVPEFSSPGYSTLQNPAGPSCGGYFTLDSAYKTR